MDFIKMNFNFLELIYKSTLNPKRKFRKIIDKDGINRILFRTGYLGIVKYDGCDELYELESINVIVK